MNECAVASLPYPLPAGNTRGILGSRARTDCRNSSPRSGHSDFPRSLPCIHSGRHLCTGARETPQGDSHRLRDGGKRGHGEENKNELSFNSDGINKLTGPAVYTYNEVFFFFLKNRLIYESLKVCLAEKVGIFIAKVNFKATCASFGGGTIMLLSKYRKLVY